MVEKKNSNEIRCKSLQFVGGGSILHASNLLGKKIVSFAHADPETQVAPASNAVREILLKRKEKEVWLTMRDGAKYVLDSAGVCLELFGGGEEQAREESRKAKLKALAAEDALD